MKRLNGIRKKQADTLAEFCRVFDLLKMCALPFIIIAASFWFPIRALAAEAEVTFGSESYSKENNEEFPIGVYIRAESKVGVYYVEVEYDGDRMRYISGGDSAEGNVVILRGTGVRDTVKYMLHFQAVGGGGAGIRIRYAEVREAVENGGGPFSISSLGAAPVAITGADESGVSFFDRVAEEDAQGVGGSTPSVEGSSPGGEGNSPSVEGSTPGGEGSSPSGEGSTQSAEGNTPGEGLEDGAGGETTGIPEGAGTGPAAEDGDDAGAEPASHFGPDTDIPVLAAVDTGDGCLRYIVDHAGYIPDGVSWNYRTVEGICEGRPVTFLTNGEGTVRILYLLEEVMVDGMPVAEAFRPYAYSGESGQMYLCHTVATEEGPYLYMSPYACSVWPEELTLQAISEDHVFFAVSPEGKGGFYQLTRENDLAAWNSGASKATASAQTRNLIFILLAAFAVTAAVSICAYRAAKGRTGSAAPKGKAGGAAAKGKAGRAAAKGRAGRAAARKNTADSAGKGTENAERKGKKHPHSPDGKPGNPAGKGKARRDRKGTARSGQEEGGLPRDELQELRLDDVPDRWNGEDDYDRAWDEDWDVTGYEEDGYPEEDARGVEAPEAGAAREPEIAQESEAARESETAREPEAAEGVEAPVISVQDVTMIFHISTGNASGIKEYLIQWLKHQITFRELTALDHVSFDVMKGEVVGIIGTNGSGKSTLLRIVSGALNPTSGQVVVDRRKVQLLTLGTGFDMELSARENVYLNGSIIGYSKEFLDRHYKEIAEFAELGDFMEEKVKNFSSGMVSRLGFAIATAGDAAEILILDEVLSVGDEFFRKKSLKRIKEMIHGGSTVLMVSHGMGTILENCTKVVWIEKGRLMMVGETRDVCEAYQRMNVKIS